MMHVTLHREVTGEGQEPSAITLPASRVVHVLRSGEAISIVPP